LTPNAGKGYTLNTYSHINMKNHTSFIKLPVEAAQLASEVKVAPGNTTMGVADAVTRHEIR